ncbi:MAG: hypothetical protein KUG73_14970 [Pseudomonadales bacterium]|nr:hypothetical protein [Pseudomonadales bacterium]
MCASYLSQRIIRPIVLLATLISVSGCSTIYSLAGNGASKYGQDVMMPYLLTTKDFPLACATGESLTSVIASFGQYTTSVNQLSVLTNMVAGLCAHTLAQEAHLNFLRLAKMNHVAAAQDARIQSKRLHTIAAGRQYSAYQALHGSFGEFGEECPMFSDDYEQLVWILGTVSAVQAVLSDTAGGGEVSVPKNLAPKAIRAAACLDTPRGNITWWGLPKAIKALLSSILPGAGEEGVDQWEQMAIASKIGDESGVRISRALMAIGAENAGKIDLLKNLIRDQVNSINNTASNRDFVLLDAVATDMIVGLSDSLWTAEKGHRTPHGSFGTFWDDAQDDAGLDIDFDDF